MNGSDVFGFEMRLAVVALALCGGLVACDGGRYDETTGRYIPGAGSRPLSAAEMTPGPVVTTAQLQNPCHRPDDLPRAALGTGGSFGVAADQRFGYAQPVAAAPAAPGTPVVDEFSRTPPAPTIQADGTPARPAIARVSPESGSVEGGEELLITGSGFGTVQVLVGNTSARVTSQSSNAITVLVPAGRPGITAVVVTNRDGSYVVAGGAYSYM